MKCFFCGVEGKHVNDGGIFFYALLPSGEAVPFCWANTYPCSSGRVKEENDLLYVVEKGGE